MGHFRELKKKTSEDEDHLPVFDVTMTRMEARALVVDHDDLENAIDEAQGAADKSGVNSFVIIKITGERL